MNTLYNQLTERSRALNQEREALIARRNAIRNELTLIEHRLDTVDSYLEDIYSDQEEFWDNSIESELLNPVGIVQEFIGNPNITQQELAKKYNTSQYFIHKTLTANFKKQHYAK